jgi:small nuclear ribonucleoprotein (snRNP)-like protein
MENPSDNGTNAREESVNRLQSLLNKTFKVKISDGRTLIGVFLCTDSERNIILGSCQEYINSPDDNTGEEPRVLGLAMVPGHHIVSICVDSNETTKLPPPDDYL